MIKIACLLVVLAVASLAQPMPENKQESPVEPTADTLTAAVPSDDMDKAETFGFGYHKHIYVAPRYYGGYYGGYYPHYAHHYGYYGYPYYY